MIAEAGTGSRRAPKSLKSARYENRELSWLEFNGRVLEEACDTKVPVAERLKFQAIVASMKQRIGTQHPAAK